jgi:hypothetical protein
MNGTTSLYNNTHYLMPRSLNESTTTGVCYYNSHILLHERAKIKEIE